jgi:hypothetical protein
MDKMKDAFAGAAAKRFGSGKNKNSLAACFVLSGICVAKLEMVQPS